MAQTKTEQKPTAAKPSSEKPAAETKADDGKAQAQQPDEPKSAPGTITANARGEVQ